MTCSFGASVGADSERPASPQMVGRPKNWVSMTNWTGNSPGMG
jgi:hypothetical protein